MSSFKVGFSFPFLYLSLTLFSFHIIAELCIERSYYTAYTVYDPFIKSNDFIFTSSLILTEIVKFLFFILGGF